MYYVHPVHIFRNNVCFFGEYGSWEYGTISLKVWAFRNLKRDAAVFGMKRGEISQLDDEREKEAVHFVGILFLVLGDTLCHRVTEAQHLILRMAALGIYQFFIDMKALFFWTWCFYTALV